MGAFPFAVSSGLLRASLKTVTGSVPSPFPGAKQDEGGMKGTKMSDNKKMPETTIATLDMEGSGSLTLTNKHLRGQVLRVIRQGNMTLKQLEQVDVLLSAVGGYSVIDIPMKIVRIIAVVVCTVVAIGTWFFYALLSNFISATGPIFITLLAIGGGAFAWFKIRDQIALQLNVMGGKFDVVFKPYLAPKVRSFITQLQQAKTEYEEANA